MRDFYCFFFFFSSRRRHTRCSRDWSSDVCSSDLEDGRRVGELDEEMVYESRPGDTFVLGATTWRIADITPSQVLVTPAPGEPGRIAFWHGDALGRPIEVGRAVGKLVRELRSQDDDASIARLQERSRFDDQAASNLLNY